VCANPANLAYALDELHFVKRRFFDRAESVRLDFVPITFAQTIEAVVSIPDVRHVRRGFVATIRNLGAELLKCLLYPFKPFGHGVIAKTLRSRL
jgi:hypothetical protein